MSWGAVGASVVGGLLGGGGGGGGQASSSFSKSSTQTDPFGLQGGLFGGSGFDGTNFNQVLDPRLGQLQGQGFDQSNQFGNLALGNQGSQTAFNLGQGFAGQLSQTDPLSLQNTLFQQQAGLLRPGFEQDTLNLESRLFSQGRLGSTGGALQQQGLQDSQNTAFGQLLANSFQQSQGQQAQTAGLAQNFLQLDPQLSGMFQNLGTQGLNNGLNIQNSANNTLFGAGTLARSSQEESSSTGPIADTVSPLSAFGGGLLTSGVQNLTGQIEGLFSPAFNDGPGGRDRV